MERLIKQLQNAAVVGVLWTPIYMALVFLPFRSIISIPIFNSEQARR
jgi:hypothetical protein